MKWHITTLPLQWDGLHQNDLSQHPWSPQSGSEPGAAPLAESPTSAQYYHQKTGLTTEQ